MKNHQISYLVSISRSSKCNDKIVIPSEFSKQIPFFLVPSIPEAIKNVPVNAISSQHRKQQDINK